MRGASGRAFVCLLCHGVVVDVAQMIACPLALVSFLSSSRQAKGRCILLDICAVIIIIRT